MDCKSLQQAASPEFGIPLPFREMAKWECTVKEQTIDIAEWSKRNYLGATAAQVPTPFQGPNEWAAWALSLPEVWQTTFQCKTDRWECTVVD